MKLKFYAHSVTQTENPKDSKIAFFLFVFGILFQGLSCLLKLRRTSVSARLVLQSLFLLLSASILSGQTPGGTTALPRLWIKANVGTSTTTEGAQVTTWTNAGSTGGSVSGATGTGVNSIAGQTTSPTYVANGFNFNPALFANTTAGMGMLNALPASPTKFTVYYVHQLGDIITWKSHVGLTSTTALGTGTGDEFVMMSNNADLYTWNPGVTANTIPYTTTKPVIAGFAWANAGAVVTNTINGKTGTSSSAMGANTRTSFILAADPDGGAEDGGRGSGTSYSEAIVFDQTLTATEHQKVQSYLAIKYGIGLDQTTATNYLASDASIIWAAATNTTYKNDVFGIGRDDNSLLLQKQSQSAEAGVQPIFATTGFAATNTLNATGFTADKSFLMAGNDAGTTSFSTMVAAPSGVVANTLFGRIWKIQETGTVGTVKVAFPTGLGQGGAVYLVRSTDATFEATDTWIPLSNLTVGATSYAAGDVDFNTGDYFTIATFITAPGCVAGMQSWIKADGITATDGSAVAAWSDASGNTYDVTQATAAYQPKFYKTTADKLINFNPTLDFDGVDDHLRNTTTLMPSASAYTFLSVGVDEAADLGYRSLFSSESAVDYFALYKQGGAANDNGWVPYAVGGQARSAPFIGDRGSMGKGTKYSVAGGANGFWNGTNFTSDSRTDYAQPQIVGMASLNNATTDPFYTWTDGYKEDPNWSPIVDGLVYRNPFFAQLSIGADVNVEVWKGRIPEFMVWNKVLTDAEMARVNTYLGIKYGITLGQGNGHVGVNGNNYNYVSGSGSVIWDATANATYKGNIAGIGKDFCQGLNQKQSKSIQTGFQPIIGLTRIDTTNTANPSVFATDASFLVWGNDAGAASFGTAITAPSGLVANNRFTRIWKVAETGTVGTVKFAVPQVGSGSTVYLIRSTDATIDATDTWIPLSTYAIGGTNYMAADVDFSSGDYFTIATYLTAPGCVTPNLSLWVKSDFSGATAGANAAAWKDNSPNSKDVPSIGTMALQAGDAAHNFHPYFTNFSASNYFYDPTSALSTDNSAGGVGTQQTTGLSVFAVVKPNSGTSKGRITGIDNDNYFAAEPGYSLVGGKPYFYKYSNTTQSFTHSTAATASQNTVVSWNFANNTTNGNTIGLKMALNGTSESFAGTGSGLVGQKLSIGGASGWDQPYPFEGDIQEVIWYKSDLAPTDVQKIQSYLAIKYGSTLSHNYLSSAGTTVYDRATYGNNILGIGREDCQSLNQKQSKSTNATGRMTIGLADSIAPTHLAHPSVFTNDASFIVIGDNGLTGVATIAAGGACPPPPSVDKFTNVSYKVTETGSVQSIKVKFDATGTGFNSLFPVYMQVATDAAFTNIVVNVPMQWSGTNVSTNYDFAASSTTYVRFMGNTTSLANICVAPTPQTFHFNGWNYGTKTKDIIANYALSANAGDMVMKATVTDGTPNVLLYRPTVDWWPVFDGLGLFIPHWGSSANQTSVITTKLQFLSQTATGAANASTTKLAAQTVDFVIRDLDGYIGSRDVVKVYGKLGAATVEPKLTRNKYWSDVTLNAGGDPTKAMGSTAPWDLTVLADVYVTFDSPVEEVYVEYTQQATYAFNSYQDLRIGKINTTCKAPTPKVVTPDNVYVYKEAASPIKSGDKATYKFTIQNTNCGDKTINFSDVLPASSGLTWADSSLTTPLSIGTVNSYGNTQTLTLSNVTVPAGVSYLYIDAKTTTAGTFNNQATFTVGSNNYVSDNPSVSGPNSATPLTVIANDPEAGLTIVKTVNKTTEAQNSILTYTFVVNNPNASAVLATFQDNLPPSTNGIAATYVASSLTGMGSAIVSPYAGTNALTVRDLSVPANGSVTLTVQANVGLFLIGDTIKNKATIVPDVASGFRLTTNPSAQIDTKITAACVAGAAAPALSATTANNNCPTATANLSTITASNKPVGTVLMWHTATPALYTNRVADSTAITTAGTYYASFYDIVADCFSTATTAVVVTITNPCPASFAFNCGTATSTGAFTANAIAGQTGTVTVPITGTTAGTATFTVTGTGFTGTLSTTLTAGQAFVIIPITYDGTGAAGARPLSITSPQGTGTCSVNATVVAPAGVPDVTTTIGQPLTPLTVGQTSNIPITVANIGTAPALGIITTTMTLPTGVTAPPMFTNNGWTCSTTAPTVTCTNPGPIAAGGSSTFNVPVTPNATIVGTKPTFNATTNPVTGETITGNNPATPMVPNTAVLPANCDWSPSTLGKF
jgi:large repetitive protein